jgi:phosphopantothenoylcysteine decarboxylase/phosphopantothenate--cysteine ligase
MLLMAAAVADFRPADAAAEKLERTAGDALELRLVGTDDVVAAAAGARRPGQTIVGFAAEGGADGVERAAAKLARKGLDAIVFNDVSRPDIGFDSDRNEVTIVEPDARHQVPLGSKEAVADAILDRIEALRSKALAAGG